MYGQTKIKYTYIFIRCTNNYITLSIKFQLNALTVNKHILFYLMVYTPHTCFSLNKPSSVKIKHHEQQTYIDTARYTSSSNL